MSQSKLPRLTLIEWVSAALIPTTLVTQMPGGTATRQLGYAAGIVGLLAYAGGFVASFWLPEPRQEMISE